jgi:hypothetical protein
MTQQAMNVSAPGLLDASTTIKAVAQKTPVRQAHKARPSKEPANPIYLLAAITLGIPLVSMIPLVGMNPSVQEGTLATITMFLVFPRSSSLRSSRSKDWLTSRLIRPSTETRVSILFLMSPDQVRVRYRFIQGGADHQGAGGAGACTA